MFLQGDTNKRTHYGFEHQFQTLYMKTVFKEFQEKLKKSTLFRIKPNTEYPHLDEYNYLVTCHQPMGDFSWSNHVFRVLAEPIRGDYTCECMLWEHTGTTFLLCTQNIVCLTVELLCEVSLHLCKHLLELISSQGYSLFMLFAC